MDSGLQVGAGQPTAVTSASAAAATITDRALGVTPHADQAHQTRGDEDLQVEPIEASPEQRPLGHRP
jgi:hypothetical protein